MGMGLHCCNTDGLLKHDVTHSEPLFLCWCEILGQLGSGVLKGPWLLSQLHRLNRTKLREELLYHTLRAIWGNVKDKQCSVEGSLCGFLCSHPVLFYTYFVLGNTVSTEL